MRNIYAKSLAFSVLLCGGLTSCSELDGYIRFELDPAPAFHVYVEANEVSDSAVVIYDFPDRENGTALEVIDVDCGARKIHTLGSYKLISGVWTLISENPSFYGSPFSADLATELAASYICTSPLRKLAFRYVGIPLPH